MLDCLRIKFFIVNVPMTFHVDSLIVQLVAENNFVILGENFVQRAIRADTVFPLKIECVEALNPFAVELAENFSRIARSRSFSEHVERQAGGIFYAKNFGSADHEFVTVDYANFDGVGKTLVAEITILLAGVEVEIKILVESHHALEIIFPSFFRDVDFVAAERDLKIIVVVA